MNLKTACSLILYSLRKQFKGDVAQGKLKNVLVILLRLPMHSWNLGVLRTRIATMCSESFLFSLPFLTPTQCCSLTPSSAHRHPHSESARSSEGLTFWDDFAR